MAKAWDGSTRRERLPSDWTDRRAFVLERDGYRCRAFLPDGRRCPRDATDVDHILEDDNDSYSNLQSLCRGHHLSKTGTYAGKQSQAARKRRRNLREPEQHWRPGGATD